LNIVWRKRKAMSIPMLYALVTKSDKDTKDGRRTRSPRRRRRTTMKMVVVVVVVTKRKLTNLEDPKTRRRTMPNVRPKIVTKHSLC